MPEKTKKCLERVKEKVTSHGKKRKDHQVKGGRKGRCLVLREVKEISCSALFRVFHRLLSCTATVDVVEQKD
jgi:hypothetical protein